LEGGPPVFNPGFPSPSLLNGHPQYVVTGLSPFEAQLSSCFTHKIGSSAFARRYLRNRCCFLFLWVLRCFTSPRSLLTPMHSVLDTLAGGLPHSEIPRSQPIYRLPRAYRRFSRPSSPLNAKTSAVRPSCLITNLTPRCFLFRIAPSNSTPRSQIDTPWA
jgi:hypothetical protein